MVPIDTHAHILRTRIMNEVLYLCCLFKHNVGVVDNFSHFNEQTICTYIYRNDKFVYYLMYKTHT